VRSPCCVVRSGSRSASEGKEEGDVGKEERRAEGGQDGVKSRHGRS
jgi:hypothetical protein